ncbi:single-stranded DNA-binding protein [candidate division KSB1 bacterium]
MLNSIVISGNLAKAPEIFYSNDGNQIATFQIACNVNKERTLWLKTVCFGKLAELSEKYLSKGAKIAVSGSLDIEEWEKDGEKKSNYKIIASSIEFIKLKKNSDKKKQNEDDGDDDLPF